MATGDITLFDQYTEDQGDGLHALSTDVIKAALIKSAANGGIDPVASTPDPRWGAGGTTNLLSSEVTPGGNYVTGGTVVSTGDPWTRSGAVGTMALVDYSIVANAGNPTNARWLIFYNDTDTGKRAIGFMDLGQDINLTLGLFDVTFNASGAYTIGA